VLFAWTVGVIHDAVPHVHGEPAHHVCAEAGVWDVLLHLVDHHAAGVPCDDHHDATWKQGTWMRGESGPAFEAALPAKQAMVPMHGAFVPAAKHTAPARSSARIRDAHVRPPGERGPPAQG